MSDRRISGPGYGLRKSPFDRRRIRTTLGRREMSLRGRRDGDTIVSGRRKIVCGRRKVTGDRRNENTCGRRICLGDRRGGTTKEYFYKGPWRRAGEPHEGIVGQSEMSSITTEQPHIERFRQLIELQYEDHPTGCGASFGELLCWEIHENGQTFEWLARKWGISLPTLGDLISDHCRRLEPEPRVVFEDGTTEVITEAVPGEPTAPPIPERRSGDRRARKGYERFRHRG